MLSTASRRATTLLLLVLGVAPFVPPGAAADDPAAANSQTPSRKYQESRLEATPARQLKADVAGPVAFSPDGKTLVLAGGRGVFVWDVATGKELHRWRKKDEAVLGLSPDGTAVAMKGLRDHLPIRETATGQERCQLGGEGGLSGRSNLFIFSPDGRFVAADYFGQGYRIRFWEAATGNALPALEGFKQANVQSMALSSDGKTLALGCDGFAIELYDWPTRKKLRQLGEPRVPHPGDRPDKASASRIVAILAVTFSPDGKTLAAGNTDGNMDLWDVATGKKRHHLGGGSRSLKDFSVLGAGGLVFSPAGRELVSLDIFPARGRESFIHLWETATGQPIGRFGNTRHLLKAVAVSPDGRTLASVTDDAVVSLWDIPTLIRDGAVPPRSPSPKELEAGWTDLAGPDALKAYQALWTLAATPGPTVALLKERLRPTVVEPQAIRQLVADLGSDQFAVRQRATEQLADLGELAGPALRQALQGQPSLEVRRRLEALLERLDKHLLSPEQLRSLRAVAVLEHADHADARRLLEGLARGTPEAPLTREAKASLSRLAKRAGAGR